jgi:hypothetical protein
MKLEDTPGAPHVPAREYMALVSQETLRGSQEFLLGLAQLTDFYGSSLYNFEEWHRSLTTAYELAAAEMR